MMYHRITKDVQGDYDTTPADFRAQLRRMFASGYRPVRTIDLARGTLPVAAGYTPVVLSFDDGYANQFQMSGSGEIDPECGVGILLQACSEFEHCPPAGSFNINRNPFGLTDPATQRAGLGRLHQLGFEIANHTFDHDDLADLNAGGVQQDMVRLQRLVRAAVPSAQVATLALPFGISPRSRALARSGSYDGETYRNEGVLLVGANPSPSPFGRDFDAGAIPRIRSMSADGGRLPLTAKYWLDVLEAHPERRYISAGNPGHVTVPRAQRHAVARAWAGKVVTY
ncbi:MAG: polysaccharide deacetylase family protein [Jatrophihabitans sp.]